MPREPNPTGDQFVNQPTDDHNFEVTATNPDTGQVTHVYFYRLDSVFFTFAETPERWNPCLVCRTPLAFDMLLALLDDHG